MTTANAWRFVAERAQSTVETDDEQIALCDALAVLAATLDLPVELGKVAGLQRALADRSAAQLEFAGFLKMEVRPR